MKQFITFLRKEFAHVLRDRKTLLILFGMPIMQILIFGFALTNEVKNAKIVIVDKAKDIATQKIIDRIEASRYFEIEETMMSANEIEDSFQKGIIKMAIVFPADFYKELLHQHAAQVQIIADASDPNTANTLTNYVSSIVQDYQREIDETNVMPYRIQPQTR